MGAREVGASVVVVGWLFLAVAAVGPSPSGVVRVARGSVQDCEARVGVSAGHLLPGGSACLEVGPRGWAELLVGMHLRVRVSAQTRLRIEEGGLRVERGRVWLQYGAASESVPVRLRDREFRIRAQSSAVFEAAREVVSVFAGEVEVGSGRMGRNQSFAGGQIVAGGSRIRALVRNETRAGLGDLEGWRAYLLAAVAEVELRTTREQAPRPSSEIDDEMGPSFFEAAVRPPPFFPEEIPPPGPNVQVEVSFDDS